MTCRLVGAKSIEELLCEKYTPLLRLVMPICRKNVADAEDLVQRTCVRVLERQDQFRGTTEKQFLSWMYQIALNFIRSDGRRYGKRFLPFDVVPVHTFAAPDDRIDEKILAEDLLRKFPTEVQDFMRKRYLEDIPDQELKSSDMGGSTHRVRFHRAVKKFLANLPEEGNMP